MTISKTNGTALFIAVILLAAAAYLMFRGETGSPVSATAGPSSEAEAAFLGLTAQIDPIRFDSSILEDERFLRLQDIRTAILPEQSGRLDPFAPLPGVKP